MLLTDEDLRARAASELRRGVPVLLRSKGRSLLILSAEMATQAMLDGVAAMGTFTDPVLAVTLRRAETLKARAYDGDVARIRLASPVTERQVRAIADPATALDAPLIGPHETVRGGDADAHRGAIGLCRRAKLLPAAIVWDATSPEAAETAAMAAQLISCPAPADQAEPPGHWEEAVSARVPISAYPNTRLRLFRRRGWDDEHYALELGEPPRDRPVLTRLHSECATGDLFGSLKCDCGPQLHAALARIAAEGAGVLVYLRQEGRGIGLANKLRAYRLQDQGFDTVDANHRLGFRDDERLLEDGGEILRSMGFSEARLMTNNPRKIAALEAVGVRVVERAPLKVGETDENKRYLEVKAEKSGHLL